MAKRKRRRQKQKQKKVTLPLPAVVDGVKVLSEEVMGDVLRRKIKRLKQLPKDFRDITPGSKDWQDFASIMGPEKEAEMLKWCRGGVLSLAPLSKMEKVFFAGHEMVMEESLKVWTWDEFTGIVKTVELGRYSYIYTPMLAKSIVNALNELASKCSMNSRFVAQIKDDRGFPVGVVR